MFRGRYTLVVSMVGRRLLFRLCTCRVYLGRGVNLIIQKSKKQTIVVRSRGEVEFIAMAHGKATFNG